MRPLHRAALGLVGLVVPAGRREGWRAEWRAELAASGAVGRSGARVLAAAVEDAVGLRLRTASAIGRGRAREDLRFAFRSLRRSPGFALAVVLTLAIGIGANVAIFSAVRGVLLRPLPYEDPSSVALVDLAFGQGPEAPPIPASEPEFWELREESTAFRDLAAFRLDDVNLGGLDEPMRVGVAGVTANFLDVLGVDVARGRGFAPGDDGPGGERLALLGHGLWQRGYGADPAVLGSSVTLDDRPHTVVGVLPADFEFPGSEIDVLYTLSLDRATPGGRSSHWLTMVARLAEGVDLEGARTRTDQLVARWNEAFPDRHGPSVDHHPVRVAGLREALTGDLRRPLLLLGVAVALVLLVACVNVAGLLLVRGDDRRRELAVRTALGADRPVLVRQLLVETLVLAGLGGLLGTALAAAGLELLPGYARSLLPPNTSLGLDGAVLLFALGATGLAALLFGVLPGWSAASGDVTAGLRAGGARAGVGRRGMLVRRALVVVEVAGAVALLAGAGVLGRGFLRLLDVDPGFDPEGVVVMDFELTPGRYPAGSDVAAFHAELRRRVGTLPTVESAGSIRTLPTLDWAGLESLDLPGRTPPPHDEEGWGWTVLYQVVDPGVFRTLGIPLVAGRAFRESDDAGGMPVAVVNRSAARALFGNEDPLGRQLRLGRFEGNPNPVMTVVGVVGDVRQQGLDREPPPQLYVTRAQAGGIYGGLGTRYASFVVRTDGVPEAVMPALREEVRALDPSLPVTNLRTLEEQVVRSTGDRRFLALLMGVFAAAALTLGAVGVYGLLAFVVSRRTREIGIRYALGAGRSEVMTSVVGEGLALVTLGAALGIGGFLVGAGLLGGLVYGVGVRDPAMLAGAPILLLMVGALASWLPARRASGVEPVRVLRSE